MKRSLLILLVVVSCVSFFIVLAIGMKPLFMGDPFVMRFVRTADMEVIEVHHPKHALPVRFVFTPQGPPLNQTIIADHSVRELPFGKKVFIDVTMKPGLVRLTHQGIDLYISSGAIYELESSSDEAGEKPKRSHKWGTALELDFRTPANDPGGANTNPVGDDQTVDDRRTIRVGITMSAAMSWLTITKHQPQQGEWAIKDDKGFEIAQFSVDRGTLVITYRPSDGRITDLSFQVEEFSRPKGDREIFTFQVEAYEAATGRLVLSTTPSIRAPAPP